MTVAATPVKAVPRRSSMSRTKAMGLARAEYSATVEMLRELPAAAWARATCNEGWDVLTLVQHTAGMTHLAASPIEQAKQLRARSRVGGVPIDALTAVQVERNRHLGPDALITKLAKLAAPAVRGRGMTSRLMGRFRLPGDQPVGPADATEPWTFGYLVDVILTRDPWMHRTDIAAATGGALVLTPEHDGVIVDDVVQEWAGRHGQPYDLVLTGPAGGHWSSGNTADRLELDAVEFCRILSGRGSGSGLLQTRVPF